MRMLMTIIMMKTMQFAKLSVETFLKVVLPLKNISSMGFCFGTSHSL